VAVDMTAHPATNQPFGPDDPAADERLAGAWSVGRADRSEARLRGDRGLSSAITLVLIAPLFFGIINITIVAGQLMVIAGDLEQASREGARVASLRNNSTQAETDGRAAALAMVQDQGVTCSAFDATLGNPADFVPGGTAEMTVQCAIPLADLGFGVPFLGTKTMERTSTEVLERYREFD